MEEQGHKARAAEAMLEATGMMGGREGDVEATNGFMPLRCGVSGRYCISFFISCTNVPLTESFNGRGGEWEPVRLQNVPGGRGHVGSRRSLFRGHIIALSPINQFRTVHGRHVSRR